MTDEKKQDPDHEEDVYKEEDVEEMLEDDELKDKEAAFMEGYDRERNKEYKKKSKD